MMKHIVITLPAVISFEDYKKELDMVKDGKQVLNFKVPFLPKDVVVNKTRVYLVHRGFVIGWMLLTGLSTKEFTCSVTGKHWNGCFIERSGDFHYLDDPVPMKGFQGFRYLSDDTLS